MAELGSTNIYGDLNIKNNNIKQVGKINDVTDTELANLKDSTSNIQAQLNGKASNAISITAGNGLSGGGTLSATRTITLGTPSTITNATTNSVTATSHTHALSLTKADIVALGIPAQDTTYGDATTSASGLMSSGDKTKLNGIATNANNYSHPTTAGNKHIPAGGATGQILKYGGSSGTAVWANEEDVYSATITTSWTGASAPYTQNVTVTGITANDMPSIVPVYSTDNATAIMQKEAWNMISKAITGTNVITFTCFEEKPITAIPIKIRRG